MRPFLESKRIWTTYLSITSKIDTNGKCQDWLLSNEKRKNDFIQQTKTKNTSSEGALNFLQCSSFRLRNPHTHKYHSKSTHNRVNDKSSCSQETCLNYYNSEGDPSFSQRDWEANLRYSNPGANLQSLWPKRRSASWLVLPHFQQGP